MRKPLVKLPVIRSGRQTTSTASQFMVQRSDLEINASGHSTEQFAGQAQFAGANPWFTTQKSLLMMLGLTAGLTLSAWGHAVGLGGINVVSALGQPLKAEIDLVAVSRADKPSLVARLASPDSYKGAGLDYPAGVKYSFQIESRPNGEPYLKLSSNREINDPFVSLLVELSWSSGRLMREYTFLLDPPGYVAEQPKPSAVQTITPAVVQSVPMAAEKPEAPAVSQPVERPAGKPYAAPSVAKSEPVATGSITVRQGDTLDKIAARNKPADVSLERMLVALYRANDSQFDGRNMNRIRSGKILRMPEKGELQSLSQADAIQEIHAQADDWNAYRQKLASAASTGRETGQTRQVTTGKITSAATDKAPVASESAREVLRLSKGEAPGDKAARKSAQDKQNSAAEEAIAKAKAVKEEKTRAALLENNLKDMRRLAELKSEAAALAASAAATQVASEVSPVAAASQVASHVSAASAVKHARVVKPAPVPEPSFIDTLLDSPLALGIGAAALLALGGLGIVLAKSRRKSSKAEMAAGDETGTKTGQLTSPVAPSPETGDFTATALPAEEVVLHPDDVDPISEAELFLNFGRDEQAEEVLKDALKHSPDNHQVHLKLLGIYANRQDAAAFAEIADLLEKTGDSEAIQQAEVLAGRLKPAAAEAGSIEEAASATQLTPVAEPDLGVDLALGEQTEEAADEIDFDVTAEPEAVDFDVTSTSPLMPASEMLDFDVSAKVPDFSGAEQHEEEALPNLDDLIFDVMSNSGTETKAEALPETTHEVPSFAADEAEDGMEFTLDFPQDETVEAPQPPAINLADISLDMDDIPAPADHPVETEKSEHWHEVATKLDLAKAYQEMGDDVGAREILDEVMLEGDEAQKQEAQLLIDKLG